MSCQNENLSYLPVATNLTLMMFIVIKSFIEKHGDITVCISYECYSERLN